METFIVLGLCFILYEALDLFQSCYSNNRPNQLTPTSASALVRQQYANNNIANKSINSNNDNCDEPDTNTKDTTRLILSNIDKFDDIYNNGDENNYLDNCVKVYSISENIDLNIRE